MAPPMTGVQRCQPSIGHTELPWSVGENGRSIVREVPGMSDGFDHYMVAVLSAHSLLPAHEASANAAIIVEAVNNYELLQQKLEFAEFEWNRATDGMKERDATIESLKARVAELEGEAAEARQLAADNFRRAKNAEAALRSASNQCGNVIFNCEQRPADNERHLSSWRGVKDYIDVALKDQPK